MFIKTLFLCQPQLFADDSGECTDDATDNNEEDDEQFKIRPEFQGKSGKKVLLHFNVMEVHIKFLQLCLFIDMS
jgi:hypothetical protein